MKNHLLSLILVIISIASNSGWAQSNNSNVSDKARVSKFWEADLPGGNYLVLLDRISSISLNTYNVKGAVIHEVDVETMGAALTRFYVIEAAGAQSSLTSNILGRVNEIGREAGKKVGIDPDTAVHKEYPITTHAKTIEFRIADKRDLDEIYKSLSKSWKENRGRKITIE